MAVITCKECGKTISSKAKSCPWCGYVYHTNVSTWKALQGWCANMSTWKVVGIFAFIFFVAVVYSSLSDQTPVVQKSPEEPRPVESEGWEQAEETVKNLPCSEGGTVDQYLTRKAAIPAIEDLGWTTTPWEGGFRVERFLLLSQTMPMHYRWHVDRTGKARPVNGKAMGITPGYFSPDPKIKSRREYQGSYKDWQPYKDSEIYRAYLELPDKYKTPENEKLYKDSYEAEETVKNLPCSEGGTVDQYLTRKATISVIEDLGWTTTPWKGGFYVERLLLVDQTISMFYRWQVDRTGKAKPIDDKAIRITRRTKDTARGLNR